MACPVDIRKQYTYAYPVDMTPDVFGTFRWLVLRLNENSRLDLDGGGPETSDGISLSMHEDRALLSTRR